MTPEGVLETKQKRIGIDDLSTSLSAIFHFVREAHEEALAISSLMGREESALGGLPLSPDEGLGKWEEANAEKEGALNALHATLEQVRQDAYALSQCVQKLKQRQSILFTHIHDGDTPKKREACQTPPEKARLPQPFSIPPKKRKK